MSTQGQKDRNWLNQEFRRDKVFKATDDELQEYLFILCKELPPGEDKASRDVIRALTLNHMLTDKIHREVRDMTCWLKWLTVAIVILSAIAVYLTIKQTYSQVSAHSPGSAETTNAAPK
jgi:hypothetical protein